MLTYDPKLILPARASLPAWGDEDTPSDPGCMATMGYIQRADIRDHDAFYEVAKLDEIDAFESLLENSGQLAHLATFAHAIPRHRRVPNDR